MSKLAEMTDGLRTLFGLAGVPKEKVDAVLPTTTEDEPPKNEGKMNQQQEAVVAKMRQELATAQTERETNLAKMSAMQTVIENQNAAITARQAEAESLKSEIETIKARFKEDDEKKTLDTNLARVRNLVRQFKIRHSDEEAWQEMAKNQPAAFAAAIPILEASKPLAELVGFSDMGRGDRGAGARATAETVAADESEYSNDRNNNALNNLALVRMKEKGIPYHEALKEVGREQPHLVAFSEANMPHLG
jgi:hypothetical protein